MTAQEIESQGLFREPLTIHYCENQALEMQANSDGCAILAPAPKGQIRPVSCIENLGEIRALPAPFPRSAKGDLRMQGPRQAKRILNWYRKRAATGRKKKRNGGYGWIDDPGLENLIANSKKRYRRERPVPME